MCSIRVISEEDVFDLISHICNVCVCNSCYKQGVSADYPQQIPTSSDNSNLVSIDIVYGENGFFFLQLTDNNTLSVC